MKSVVQHACDPSATITSILNISNNNHSEESISNPENASIYFSALLSNSDQIPISTQVGIVGLLLAPMNDIVDQHQNQRGLLGSSLNISVVDADLCRTYLMAFSRHVDAVLDLWRMARLESRHFADLMKVCEFFNHVWKFVDLFYSFASQSIHS